MENFKGINQQLKTAYEEWINELIAIAPQFNDDKYSNPYCAAVDERWTTSEIRILVVGEEGFGTEGNKSFGDSRQCIGKLQEACIQYMNGQLYREGDFSYNRSAFWSRFRKLSKYGACAWTNIDKFHLRRDNHCALTAGEREILHSTKSKILATEIEILKPTHIVFFGWYGESLKHELPELHKKLYPGGEKDNSVWFENVIPEKYKGINCLFTYHPGWGQRQKRYEAWVMAEFIKQLP